MAHGFRYHLGADSCFQPKGRKAVAKAMEGQVGQAMFPNQSAEIPELAAIPDAKKLVPFVTTA